MARLQMLSCLSSKVNAESNKKALRALKALQGRIGLVCQTSYQLPDATTYSIRRCPNLIGGAIPLSKTA